MNEELIKKIRQYLSTAGIDEFKKGLVETQISLLSTGNVTLDIFKINVSLILDINLNDI